MKKSILILILFITTISFSQKVKTIVAGPSTFNDGLALDSEGNIYAARFYSSTITKITHEGQTSIFADGFKDPNGINFDNFENLLVPSANGGRIDKVNKSGQVSLFKTIKSPHAVVVDKDNNVYVAHYPDDEISKIDQQGNVTTFWSNNGLNGPVGLVIDEEGNFYAGNFNNGKIFKRSPNGEISQIGDIPGWLGFMTLAGNNIYATAFQQHRIYKVPIDGSGQSVFTGTGLAGQKDGDISEATFSAPNGIVATQTGDTLYVSDYNTRSLRMIYGINSVTDIEESKNIPNGLSLEQNYPNPFNPSTTISFSLPSSFNSKNNSVKILVYDVLGNTVKELLNERKSEGTYSVEFNAANLSSGIYYYSLQIENFVLSKKMLLLK